MRENFFFLRKVPDLEKNWLIFSSKVFWKNIKHLKIKFKFALCKDRFLALLNDFASEALSVYQGEWEFAGVDSFWGSITALWALSQG